MSKPTRFTNGVGTTKAGPLRNLGMPDPTKWITYFEDFIDHPAAIATEWEVTTVEAGAGSATEVITSQLGGILTLTNAAGASDSDFLMHTNSTQSAGIEKFLIVAGKQMFFKARFKASDATQSNVLIGLHRRDTTPLGTTTGIYFQKDDGDTDIDFKIGNGTLTTEAAIGTLVDDTYIEVGFAYDGGDKVEVFVDDALVYIFDNTTADRLPDLVGTDEMTIGLGIGNGEAVAKVMDIDYIFVAQER